MAVFGFVHSICFQRVLAVLEGKIYQAFNPVNVVSVYMTGYWLVEPDEDTYFHEV